MNGPANSKGMPLAIWGRALLVALILLAALYVIVSIRDNQPGYSTLKDGKAEEITNANGNNLDGYFLGSSLTSYALIQNNSFDSLISKQKEKFNYKIVFGSRYCLQDFNDKIEEILKLRPRYLFIESNIACLEYHGDGFSKFRLWLSNIPIFMIMRINREFGLFGKPGPHSAFGNNALKTDHDFLNSGIVDMANVYIKTRKADAFPEWVAFYKQAARLGIKVYLLEIPRSFEAEQFLPVKIKQEYSALVKEYSHRYNIGYLDFPFKLGKERYYRDRAHFNQTGSYCYSTWLVKRIRNGNL